MKRFAILIALLSLLSCRQQKVLSSNTETLRIVEVETERKDTLLPGFTIRTQFAIPEIIEREVHDTLTIIDPETEAELKLWKDNYGNLVAVCDDKDQVIERLRESIVKSSSESKEIVLEKDTKTWWQKLTQIVPWWGYLLFGFFLGILLRFSV